jgi:protein phosphatase
MGTTCLALAIQQGRAYCAYVGDSRLYLLREGTLYQMSEDHSLIRQMLNQGLLTPEEARGHEDGHVVLRALGTRPTVAITTWPAPFAIQPGDRFLACTDGLYDLVDDDAIARTVQEHPPDDACARLVREANARGGHDNISVGVLYIEDSASSGSDGPSSPAATPHSQPVAS